MAQSAADEQRPAIIPTISTSDAHNELSTDGDEHDINVDAHSVSSIASRISLDARSFRALLVAHLLALLPAILFIGALTALARFTPCRLHLRDPRPPHQLGLLPPDDDHRSSLRCATVLTDGLTSITIALGFAAWLAAYALRPICWSIAHFTTHIQPRAIIARILLPFSRRSPVVISLDPRVTATTIVAILLRTVVLEVLRLGSVGVAIALLAAEISRLHRVRTNDPLRPRDEMQITRFFHRKTPLDPFDPRLSLGLWCALGWAAAEILVGTFQTFAQLRLYAPSQVDVSRTPYLAWTEETGESNWGPLPGVDPAVESEPLSSESEVDKVVPQRYMTRLEEEADQSMTPRPAHEVLSASVQLSSTSSRPRRYGATDDAAYRDDSSYDTSSTSPSAIELDQALTANIDRLLTTHRRSELEAQIGLPLPEVSPILVALWRTDSVIFNIGATLFAAAAWAASQGPLYVRLYPILAAASHHDRWRDEFHLDPPHLFPPFHRLILPLALLSVLHAALSTLWTLALPKLGFATVTYLSLLFAMSLTVTAAAWWGAVS